MNLLITGGCGFIGSNFINSYFINNDYIKTLTNLDVMYYCANELNININIRKSSRYNLVKGTICDADLVNYILNKFNISHVIHFAAQSHVQNSFNDSKQYTKDNVLGTHVLLECCRLYGKVEKFIHVSTDEVYGESMLDKDEKQKTEQSILCPSNPYAATKASAELIAQSYYHSFKMPIVITRGNNVYGPNQYPEKLIPKFIDLLNNDKKVTIQGDGSNVRAFLHVDDTVNAFKIILEKGEIGEIYNIGCDDGMEYSVLDIAKMLIKLIKHTDDYKEWIEYIEDRPFNDKRYYISNEKVKNLGWKINVNFEVGLKVLCSNYNIQDDFSPQIYKLLNSDLKNMSDLQATIHYYETGIHENRKYKYILPDDFSPQIYKLLNSDLKNMSDLQVEIHYYETGVHENRKYKFSDFNLNFNFYVYCSAKSGSSTLAKTFIDLGFNVLHVHNEIDYIKYHPEYHINQNLFDVINKSINNNEHVYFIDVYRNPIERKLSNYFHTYYRDDMSDEYILEHFNKLCCFIENYTSINEILDFLNIRHFDKFDFINKYNLIQHKNITIIKLRFQDIKEWNTILSNIFNKNIVLSNCNLTENKSYYKKYKEIQNKVNVPDILVEVIKHDDDFKIYNTIEEQKNYIESWQLKSYKYEFKNIPDDFDIKTYMKLNNELLTRDDLIKSNELLAKIHYDIHGKNLKYRNQ
jgi:dTDP-glucose 4,6-dehydratase